MFSVPRSAERNEVLYGHGVRLQRIDLVDRQMGATSGPPQHHGETVGSIRRGERKGARAAGSTLVVKYEMGYVGRAGVGGDLDDGSKRAPQISDCMRPDIPEPAVPATPRRIEGVVIA